MEDSKNIINENEINNDKIKNVFIPTIYNDNYNNFPFQPTINKKSKIIAERELNNNKGRNPNKMIKSNRNNDLNQQVIKNDKLNDLIYENLKKKIKISVKKFEKNNEINFIGIANILSDLEIFRIILSKPNTDTNFKNEIEMIKYKLSKEEKNFNQRLKDEIDFLEQIWLLLKSPNDNNYINSEEFSNILEILFLPEDLTIKEISDILLSYLQQVFLFEEDIDKRLKKNSNEDISFNSSMNNFNEKTFITENIISFNERWSIPTLVKKFRLLKKNRIAYKKTRNLNKSAEKDLKTRKKNMPFKPILNNNNSKPQKYNPQKYKEIQELKKNNLLLMKKKQEEIELEDCTFQPEINNKKLNNDKNNIFIKLYQDANDRKKIKEEKKKKYDEEKEKEFEQYKFKPIKNVISDEKLKKIFVRKILKGFDEYIEKKKNGILKRLEKDYLLNHIPIGENYENIKTKMIKEFNLSKPRIKEIGQINKGDFILFKIRILGNKIETIKIYENENVDDVINNFFKKYAIINNDIKNIFIEKIKKLMIKYLKNNKDESKECNDNDDQNINSKNSESDAIEKV